MDWLRGLIGRLIANVKEQIMNDIELKFAELESTIADEKAQVLEKVNGLEEMISELQNKLAGGISTTEVVNRINAAIAEVRGIVTDEAAVVEPPIADTATPDEAAEAPQSEEVAEEAEEETEEE